MVETELVQAFIDSKQIEDEEIDELNQKYIQLLAPVILRRIIVAKQQYDELRKADLNVSSLAKELGVTRQSLHNKSTVMAFIEFCRTYNNPLFELMEKNRKLQKDKDDLQTRIDNFMLRDFENEKIKEDLSNTRAERDVLETQNKNLEATLRKKNAEIEQLRKQLSLRKDSQKPISALPKKTDIITTIITEKTKKQN